jgi:hypothetical protein
MIRRTWRASARAILELLADSERATRFGEAARRRVIERFLGVYRLRDYVDLIASLDATASLA